MTSPIERMGGKLIASRQKIGEKMRTAKGKELEILLQQREVIDGALSWQPLPASSGSGGVGEATRRMSRGQRP